MDAILHRLPALLLCLLFLFPLNGCTAKPIDTERAATTSIYSGYAPVVYQEQTLAQLRQCFTAQQGIIRPKSDQKPIVAAWLPYLLYDTLFSAQDEYLCRNTVHDYLLRAKKLGINTIFAHAYAFGEAYYVSDLLPPAQRNCTFDPFALLSEECRSLNLSLHAWLNPLRLQTPAQMERWKGEELAARWYQDPEQRANNMILWENRWYFNPSEEAVRDLICRSAAELLNRYPIDGIHIDDYFYPTMDAAFDAHAFAESGATDLSQWRREQVSLLVAQLYETVHNVARDAVFSISPQGSIPNNINKLFADVTLWCSTAGYCDWMIPQLYYGFQNESMPFSEILAQWSALPRVNSVQLLAGLATYKVGTVDTYAGSGSNEWQTDVEIPARETTAVLTDDAFSGVAYYHIGTTLSMPQSEQNALQAAISLYRAKQ